jgi:hypothetical protein
MKAIKTHWVNRLTALGLVCGLSAAVAVAGVAQSVAGQAYGAYANTPTGSISQSPLAVLPFISGTDGDMANAESASLSAGSALAADFLNSITSGAIGTQGDPSAAAAQSVSSLGNVNLLGGLITASGVVATVSSTRTASGAVSNANGSTITDLAIAGVGSLSGDAPVAPNTNISLPGVGYVVLNEQIPSGDGVTSSGLTVNMIHVYLQSLTGGGCVPLLGCLPGTLTTTGEIIVGSASSAVGP